MKTVIDAFVAQLEQVLEKKRDIEKQRERLLLKINAECQNTCTRVDGEEITEYMSRMTNYIKEFKNNQKPELERLNIGKLNVRITPRILASFVPQFTTIYGQLEEGKEFTDFDSIR